jgi:hypothetical protein
MTNTIFLVNDILLHEHRVCTEDLADVVRGSSIQIVSKKNKPICTFNY